MIESINHQLTSTYNHMDYLLAEMSANGMKPAHLLDLINGLLCRFDIQDDRTGSKCGWIVYYSNSDESVVAVYGSWKTSQQFVYSSRGSSGGMSYEATLAIKLAREQAAQERENLITEGTAKCFGVWNNSAPATEHPYLKRKVIKPHHARINSLGALVIPIRNISGNLISLQYIGESFGKLFARHARTQGGFCPFGLASEGSTILIAEGFATAATLHEATGLPTVAALSASNILPVALAIHAKYPNKQFIVCADNDAYSLTNTGLEKANSAATAIQADLIYPLFDNGEVGTDFNDLALLRGKSAVRVMVLGVIN